VTGPTKQFFNDPDFIIIIDEHDPGLAATQEPTPPGLTDGVGANH
jgi:hypothetical protein